MATATQLFSFTNPLGGILLQAAGCFTTQCGCDGALPGMVVSASPRTYPGDGTWWDAYVSGPDIVTVKLCTDNTQWIPPTVFDVAVTSSGAPVPVSLAEFILPNQNAPVALTKVTTIPADGLYAISNGIELVTTNNVGQISMALTWTNGLGVVQANQPVVINNTANNFDSSANRYLEMKGGTDLSVSTTFSGVTGTTYNILVAVFSS